MQFKDLIQEAPILKVLEELKFDTPTPIQSQAIPPILQGNDVCGAAQTGTGKTAAYILPTLSRLSAPFSGKGPRVLILVPTRELAMQVATETVKLSRHLPHLVTVCVYGGVPYHVQNKKIGKKCDLLIATPGRLIDFMEQGKIDLSKVQTVILDEADRMLDMGFIEPIEFILSQTPKKRQTLMFSATYGKKVLKLVSKHLFDPIKINIDCQNTQHENIEQKICAAHNLEHKFKLLHFVLADDTIQQAIVFSATKSGAETIASNLQQNGFAAAALHGDMTQRQRSRAMQLLRDEKIRILVATDVAARGIDVVSISHVINFDLPNTLDDYIHRIGRTGRAGAKGLALSFASTRDAQLRKQIEKFIGQKMTTLSLPEQNHIKAPPIMEKPKSKFSNKFYGGGGKGQGAKNGFARKKRFKHGAQKPGSHKQGSQRPGLQKQGAFKKREAKN